MCDSITLARELHLNQKHSLCRLICSSVETAILTERCLTM